MRPHSRRSLLRVAAAFVVLAGCGFTAHAAPVVEHPPIVPVAPRARELAAEAKEAADRLDPPLRRATFAFTGDVLPHDPVIASAQKWGDGAYDFAPMFARIAPIIRWADLGVCHLETPIAPDGEPLSPSPRYGVPKEVAAGIAAAGYDRCTTASNHSLDRGVAGIDATLNALDQAGLSHAGSARTPEESEPPQLIDVNGISVASLSYTWSFNGFTLPADQQWRANLIDPQRIISDAFFSRAAGAEVVIVSLHWGNEGDLAVSSYQRKVANEVMGSGTVDLIVGHHAHVVQPIEQVAGRWVVFGLGNVLSNMPTGAVPGDNTQDGIVATVVISEREDGTFEVAQPVVYPTWVDRDHGHVIRPVIGDLTDPNLTAGVRQGLTVSLERTRRVVGNFFPTN